MKKFAKLAAILASVMMAFTMISCAPNTSPKDVVLDVDLDGGVVFGAFNGWDGATGATLTKADENVFVATFEVNAGIENGTVPVKFTKDWVTVYGKATVVLGGTEVQANVAVTDNDCLYISGVTNGDTVKLTVTSALKVKAEKVTE